MGGQRSGRGCEEDERATRKELERLELQRKASETEKKKASMIGIEKTIREGWDKVMGMVRGKRLIRKETESGIKVVDVGEEVGADEIEIGLEAFWKGMRTLRFLKWRWGKMRTDAASGVTN